MPLRITGMIGVAPPAAETTVHIITGGISKEYTRDFAQAHDKAGFDWALVGYTSRAADGFGVASYCAAQTERLGYLIAHRPGFVAPTLAARKQANPAVRILIRADGGTPVRFVNDVINAAAKAGVVDVTFATVAR